MVLKRFLGIFSKRKSSRTISELKGLVETIQRKVEIIQKAAGTAASEPEESGADIGPVVLLPTEGGYEYKPIDASERKSRIGRMVDGAISEIIYGNPLGRDIGVPIDKEELKVRWFPGSAVPAEIGLVVWDFANNRIDKDAAIQLLEEYRVNPKVDRKSRVRWVIEATKYDMERWERKDVGRTYAFGRGKFYPEEVSDIVVAYSNGEIGKETAKRRLDILYERFLEQYRNGS